MLTDAICGFPEHEYDLIQQIYKDLRHRGSMDLRTTPSRIAHPQLLLAQGQGTSLQLPVPFPSLEPYLAQGTCVTQSLYQSHALHVAGAVWCLCCGTKRRIQPIIKGSHLPVMFRETGSDPAA